jgi:hypothetical protein
MVSLKPSRACSKLTLWFFRLASALNRSQSNLMACYGFSVGRQDGRMPPAITSPARIEQLATNNPW